LRRKLSGDLQGVWIGLPGVRKIPGTTFNAYSGLHSGRFDRFCNSFCNAIAEKLDRDANREEWAGVAANLRNYSSRDGLRLTGIRRILPLATTFLRDMGSDQTQKA
jgi:hypothetical protein